MASVVAGSSGLVVPMKVEPFVQMAEVWVPDGDELRHQAGAYGKHANFARRSVQMRFRYGEGLVGDAWKQRRPVLWNELGSAFLRRDEAKQAGLSAGLAIPFFAQDRIAAVLVLFCGSRETTGGGLEIWQPQDDEMLALDSAYYGSLDAELRPESEVLRFARGTGLPGRAWWLGGPCIVEDLQQRPLFVRSDVASRCGLGSGMALPLFREGRVQYVLTFLSALGSPLARAFEIWRPDPRGHLRPEESAYGPGLEEFAKDSRRCVFGPSEGLPGRAYSSGLPTVFGTVSVGPFVRHQAAERAGLEIGIGIPLDAGGATRAVALMLL